MTASLYPRIGHVLKPPGVLMRGVTTFLKPGEAKYLTIFVCGVNKQFQGKRNPRSPQENFAASIFAILEDFAAKKASCEGLKLWVRTSNSRAIRFYEKFGFFQDTSGPVQEAKEGSPHLTMWKPLGS
ncbi:MAG: GNAT family N-acetyltransferase [Synechococcaceae cyanobacterium MAG-AL2]|nr:GNAT family N-acetyltransferase [Candidatus Regnicoccus frigidus MAG-AL2]